MGLGESWGWMGGAGGGVRRGGEPGGAGTVAEELAWRRETAALKHMGDVTALQVSPAACEHHARRVGEHALARDCAASVAAASAALRGKGSPLERVSDARPVLATMPTALRGQRADSIRAGMGHPMETMAAPVDARPLGTLLSTPYHPADATRGFKSVAQHTP